MFRLLVSGLVLTCFVLIWYRSHVHSKKCIDNEQEQVSGRHDTNLVVAQLKNKITLYYVQQLDAISLGDLGLTLSEYSFNEHFL